MSLVVGFLLIAAVAVFVAVPFFRASMEADSVAAVPRGRIDRQRLERQKTEAYAAIKEAEFDYRMGKLSETDFASVRERYGAQALEAIAALDAAAAAAQPRQLAEARGPTRIAFCPSCGRGVPPRANFCPACGRSLKEAVA